MARSFLISLAVLALSSCAAEKGNTNVVSQQREVASFSKVSIGSGIHATITKGATSVKVITDENLQVFVESVVRDDTLFVDVAKKVALDPTGELVALVTNDVLAGLSASGGARVLADATPADQWPLSATGGSNINLSGLQTPQLTLDASGGSIVQAFGSATSVTATGSGGSQVLTEGVDAENFTLEASGGSIFHVRATKSAQGNASGGSTLVVSGHPAVRAINYTADCQLTWAAE